MSNKLTTIIQEQGVSHSETEKLIQVFGGPFEEAKQDEYLEIKREAELFFSLVEENNDIF